MQLHDAQSARLYLSAYERRAFMAAEKADRPLRKLCAALMTPAAGFPRLWR
jgi:hypothetical protein